MAGVGGSLLYIFFSAVLAFTNQETFLCLLPTVIIYQMTYGQILKEPSEAEQVREKDGKRKKDRDVQVKEGTDSEELLVVGRMKALLCFLFDSESCNCSQPLKRRNLTVC
jgi:hypothetical protein